MRHVITHKEIVKKYDHIISNIMIHNVCSCELLLDEYLADKGENMKYYFPQSLIKTKLVEMYVESDKANLNYLKLIFESLSSNDIR